MRCSLGIRTAFATRSGTVRFTPEMPIDATLVRTLARARIAETDATDN